MRPRLTLAVATIVFLAVVGFALTRKPMYQAESLTYIEPLASKVLSDGSEGSYDPSRYDSYLQQQIQTATRPDILEAAIAKLPVGAWQQPGEDVHTAAERLGTALKVQRVGTSYQLSISMIGANPVSTAAIVNAATNAYLEKGLKDEHARADGRQVLLTEESQRLQAELQQDRDEQKSLAATLGVADPVGNNANPYDMQLAGLRTELVAAQQAHDVAAAQLASVSGPQSEGLKAVAEEAIANDPGLGALKSTINQRRASLNSQMAGYTPANPVYKQDQEELAELDRQVAAREAQLRQQAEQRVEAKLRLDLQRTGDVEARLNGQLAHSIAQAGSAAPRLQRASELAADIARLQLRYATVDDALRGLALETNGPGTAHLSVAATIPTAPEASKRGLLLGLATPLALLAGIIAAVVARKRDPLVYTAQDVEELLGFLPLGVMPSSYEVSEAVNEEFLLRLAAGLERAFRLSKARSFVFTATSAPSEVNSFVQEIQRKLEELGFKAIAIDAGQALRMNQEPGEQGSVSPSPRSQLVSARPLHGESFATSKLERLKQDHHFVLIAAQPLLHSAEAEYAVSSADATILVLESAATTSAEVLQTGRLLRRLKASGVGVVLRDLHLKHGTEEFRASIHAIELRPEAQPNFFRYEQEADADMAGLQGPDAVEIPGETSDPEEVVPLIAAISEAELPEAIGKKRTGHETRAVFVDAAIEETAATVASTVHRLEITLVSEDTEPIVLLPAVDSAEPAEAEAVTSISEPIPAPEPAIPTYAAAMAQVIEPTVSTVTPKTEIEVDQQVDAVAPTLRAQATVQVPRMILWQAQIKRAPASAHERPKPTAEPVSVLAVEPSQDSEPHTIIQAAAGLFPAAAKYEPELQAPELEPAATIEILSAPIAATSAEPQTLTSVMKEPVVEEPRLPPTIPTTAHPYERRSAVIVPWAPRPERRRAPRILQYPQGLARIKQSSSSRRDAHFAAPRMTSAEQAVAQAISRRRLQQPPELLATPHPETTVTPNPRRWGLLGRFDTELPNPRIITGDQDGSDRAAAV
jgi:uncharacterized protein involved in exopolysaccharide biosynthesis